jgi:HSP20 family protein
MAITRWGPSTDLFRDLDTMQKRMNHMFGDIFGSREGTGDELTFSSWNPAVDVVEREDNFIIEAELPGIKKEDIHISFVNEMLTIRGEKKVEKEEKKKNYHRSERSYGSFSRTFNFPGNVKADKVDAEFNNGVLKVIVPKSEEAKPKQIEVKVK